MKILLKDIIIPKSFQKSKPKFNKLYACQSFYESYGKMDRDIYIDENNVLVNGYIAYLVYKNLGIEKIKVKRGVSKKKTPNRKRFILFLKYKR